MTNSIPHFEMTRYGGFLVPINVGGWMITSNIQWFVGFVRTNSLARHPVYLADASGRHLATHGETRDPSPTPHKVHILSLEQEIVNALRTQPSRTT